MNKSDNMRKTMKAIGFGLWVIGMLFVSMPTLAQQNWRGQQPVYGQQYRQQPTNRTAGGYHSGNYRAGSFHSTGSSMMRTGSSYSSKPTINQYGSAVSNGGPRRSKPTGGSGPHRGLINWGSGDDTGGEAGGTGGGEGEGGYVGDIGGGGGGGLVTPDYGDDDDRPNGTPIGDALIPLTLLALAYLVIRAARRKVRSTMSER